MDSPMDSPMASCWSEMPADVMALIVTLLQCFVDRASFAAVCRAWNAVARSVPPPPPRQLPWLFLPSDDGEQPGSFVSFLSGSEREISLPEDVQSSRYCGSHDGGWIALAGGHHGPYQLYNALSEDGARVRLPMKLRRPSRNCQPVVIRGVVLSGEPTSDLTIAAALSWDGVNIIFCRPTVDRYWVTPLMDAPDLDDIHHYNGEIYQGFYVISKKNQLSVYVASNGSTNTPLVMRKIMFSDAPVADDNNQLPRARQPWLPAYKVCRYLVESRGNLLMVIRYSQSKGHWGKQYRTLHFRVFEMTITAVQDGCLGHAVAWKALDDMDGRLLFVGRGCSRAFEAGDYLGFEHGGIYFLDDDSEISFMLNDPIRFPAVDMGMFTLHESIVRPGLKRTASFKNPDGQEAHDEEDDNRSIYSRRVMRVIRMKSWGNGNNQLILNGRSGGPTDDAVGDDDEASTSSGIKRRCVTEKTFIWRFECEPASTVSRPGWFFL